MTRWIPESASSSTSSDARERTAYLTGLRTVVRTRAERYLAAEPDGEQVVLACLDAVGHDALEALKGDRALGTVKLDFALLVRQTLVDDHGAGHVQTLRRDDGRTTTIRNPQADLSWVFSYTPQRVVRG